jgi:hypothetical protein
VDENNFLRLPELVHHLHGTKTKLRAELVLVGTTGSIVLFVSDLLSDARYEKITNKYRDEGFYQFS